jgi:hypothetical protein
MIAHLLIRENEMKYYATLSAIAILAFALGWFMRGDIIYGSMFNYTIETATQLPIAKGK